MRRIVFCSPAFEVIFEHGGKDTKMTLLVIDKMLMTSRQMYLDREQLEMLKSYINETTNSES